MCRNRMSRQCCLRHADYNRVFDDADAIKNLFEHTTMQSESSLNSRGSSRINAKRSTAPCREANE